MPKPLSEMSLEELWQLFPIILEEHNEAYATWYKEEKTSLYACLKHEDIYRMEHIGSTSVNGLLAKPTVDILLEFQNTCDVEEWKETLKKEGWVLMNVQEKPNIQFVFNKGYTSQGFAEKVFHLHVRPAGDWGELYFRDYLIEHLETAKEYAFLKKSIWKEFEHNRDGNTNAKTEFIQEVTEKARLLYQNRYRP